MTTARVIPSGGTSLLLEREVQVAALQALVDAARSGSGRFVVIEGTAGIGKTRLLAEARAIAGAAGMRGLTARGGRPAGAAWGTHPPGGSPGGFASRCSRPPLRISAPSCSQGLPP